MVIGSCICTFFFLLLVLALGTILTYQHDGIANYYTVGKTLDPAQR